MGTLIRLAPIIASATPFASCSGLQPPLGSLAPRTRIPFDYRTRQFVTPAIGGISSRLGAPSYKVSNSLLYVVNFVTSTDRSGDVAIYDARAKDPKPIAVVTDGIEQPGGDCIDASGTLYVPNQGGNVAEYALGKTKPFQYITQGRGTPVACTIDNKGNLWLATISDVIEYLKGAKKPHKYIENGVTYANSVVFDNSGNMYVGNNLADYNEQSYVDVYPPGQNSPSRTITDGITYPVGTAVDANGALYVTNLANANGSGCGNIEEYAAGQSDPFRTISDKIDGPTALTFDANELLYETNTGIGLCTRTNEIVLEFPLGSIRPLKRTITTFHDPTGIAYYPPQLP